MTLVDYTKLMDVVTHEEFPTDNVSRHTLINFVETDDIDHAIPDAMEIVDVDFIENAEDAVENQFSKRLIACNMNGRCHGMVCCLLFKFKFYPTCIIKSMFTMEASIISSCNSIIYILRLCTFCRISQLSVYVVQHIPPNIKIDNRDWKKGDAVIFRSFERSWNITIVLNNGNARFSGGWSRFVRDKKIEVE